MEKEEQGMQVHNKFDLLKSQPGTTHAMSQVADKFKESSKIPNKKSNLTDDYRVIHSEEEDMPLNDEMDSTEELEDGRIKIDTDLHTKVHQLTDKYGLSLMGKRMKYKNTKRFYSSHSISPTKPKTRSQTKHIHD